MGTVTRSLRIDPDPEGERRAAARARLAGRSPRRPRALAARCARLLAALLLLSIAPVALLRVLDPPATAFMLGEWLAARADGEADFRLRRAWKDSAQIAAVAAKAVIAAEDQRFFEHHGFDFVAIRAALVERAGGGRLRGASTLSQQLAKNLFLWRGRDWLRKGLEAWFTLWLELLCPKRRILELYLNVAQFGPGLYGVEAASREFFGHGAGALDADEAALLAAVLPNPRAYRVARPSDYVRGRQAFIRAQMRRLGPRAP